MRMNRNVAVVVGAWLFAISVAPVLYSFAQPVWHGPRPNPLTLNSYSISDAYTKTQVDALIAGVSSSPAFPVGAVYINVTGTNPATELGYGTWTSFGAGRTLVGRDSGDTDFDVALETGGAKTVASAGSVASHTHTVTSNVAVANHTFTQPTISWPAGVPTFAGNALAGHQHELPFQMPSGTVVRSISSAAFGTGTSRAATSTASFAANSASAAVAMSESVSAGTPSGTISWPAGVPTNASGAVDAHSVTNNAVTSGGTAPAFTGSATSVVQPYVVVYFWRRSA